MQTLPKQLFEISLNMPRARRSRSAASPPPPEELPPSVGAVAPAVVPAASAVPIAASGPASAEPAPDAAPVVASGRAPVSVAASGLAPAASGQAYLPLPPAPVPLAAVGPSAGPIFPGYLTPSGPSLATPVYALDGDVTINFAWVRQHLPIVVEVLVTNDCLALWPDICAELSAKYAQTLEAGRFPESWLLSRAGRTAALLVAEEFVRATSALSFVP
jgi:hypothetical protein